MCPGGGDVAVRKTDACLRELGAQGFGGETDTPSHTHQNTRVLAVASPSTIRAVRGSHNGGLSAGRWDSERAGFPSFRKRPTAGARTLPRQGRGRGCAPAPMGRGRSVQTRVHVPRFLGTRKLGMRVGGSRNQKTSGARETSGRPVGDGGARCGRRRGGRHGQRELECPRPEPPSGLWSRCPSHPPALPTSSPLHPRPRPPVQQPPRPPEAAPHPWAQ